MTDTSTDTDAATSNDGSDNTTTNAIIWTTAKTPSSKKKRSCGSGKSSRRRFSSRKKHQLTPTAPISKARSKDTATLLKKKSSGAGSRSSRRRHSRRKKQKRELTLELKSDVSLVDEAPTKSKHARGPLFPMGTISMTRKTAFSFLLAVMFALMFISKLLTGILCTVDNDLPAFGCKDSLRSINADFCFKKLPISALFPSVNYTNPKTPRADIYDAPIFLEQTNKDTQGFLALSNGNNAGDFEHGCPVDGNGVLQKTKNIQKKNNNDFGGLSCGPSCFTLQGRIYFQQNKTWSNNFLGLDIIPFEAILRDWMEKKENETIELKPQSELPRWIPKGAAHSFLQRPAHNNDAQSIAKDILEMGTAGRFLTMTMNIQARDFVEPPRKGSICKQSWPKLSTFKHREASMASAITNLEARNEKAIEVKSPHISARASRSLWRRIVFHVSGAPLCAVQDALLCILESMIFAFYFASFASSIFVFGLMLWRPRIFRPRSKNASNDFQAHLLVALMIYVVMVVPAAASVITAAGTKRSAAAEAFSLKPGGKNAKTKFAGSLPSEAALSEDTHSSSSSDSSESMENLAMSETNSVVTAGIDHGSRPKERSKTGGSLRNVIDHRELPVAEKEAQEFTAVTSSTHQSQLSIVDKAGIESLPSVSQKAVAIFPSVATKRKLTTTFTTTSLRTAVSAWCDDETSATTTYGHISTWDTSEVTSMSSLFFGYCSSASTFNSDISTWDGKCRCCLFIAHDESKLFHCRLTYVCRLLCVGCIIESSPLLRSRRQRPPPPPPQCRA